MANGFAKDAENPIPIYPVRTSEWSDWIADQSPALQQWAESNDFNSRSGTVLRVPGQGGVLSSVIAGYSGPEDFWCLGDLPRQLPAGDYEFLGLEDQPEILRYACLAWGFGAYQYQQYRKSEQSLAKLALDDEIKNSTLVPWVSTVHLVRDLINTPTEHLGPGDLANIVARGAEQFDAKVRVIKGDELLEENYPGVHAVGRASHRQPCLIDLQWGDPKAPKVTLIGKGVCFDSGGLNIKTTVGMRYMKKDMAGAAHAFGLARMIMLSRLPVRLRLLIPAVENSVSGSAYRPGDVITMRSGKTVEIVSTDAEGRMILADALTEAASEQPDYIFDFATLTGNVTLGNSLPALYCNDTGMADKLLVAAQRTFDPVWHMPLHQPYLSILKSDVADYCNCGMGGHGAGSITAALFLQQFVELDPENKPRWAHVDFTAWNAQASPGHPVGGEVFAIRAVYNFLLHEYRPQ